MFEIKLTNLFAFFDDPSANMQTIIETGPWTGLLLQTNLIF